jgi:hypothetical protein
MLTESDYKLIEKSYGIQRTTMRINYRMFVKDIDPVHVLIVSLI